MEVLVSVHQRHSAMISSHGREENEFGRVLMH